MQMLESHKLFFGGKHSIEEDGVGFLVRKKVVRVVLSRFPNLRRLISIPVTAEPHYMTIIQLYTLTSVHGNGEMELFCEEWEVEKP